MFEEQISLTTPTRRYNDSNGNDFDRLSPSSIANNNNNDFFKSPSTNQYSLASGEGQLPSANQSLLAPPSFFSSERRLSSSSTDSLTSQGSRRRSRRNSACRLSELGDDKNDVTLMTVAKGAQTACQKVGKSLRYAAKSFLVSRPKKPKLVCEAEVMEQANWICKDYVINKLTCRDLMSRKVGLSPPNWPQSSHVISAGDALETLYPRTYSNVSRKLSMTMSSTKIVRSTLTLLLDVLFEGVITWGKVVSMFVVSGQYAEECCSQGHPDFVQEVVDVVMDFTGSHLLEWLVLQGGWDAFPVPGGGEKNRLSKMRVLMVAGGTAAIVYSTSRFFKVW